MPILLYNKYRFTLVEFFIRSNFKIIIKSTSSLNDFSILEGDNDSGVDETTQGNVSVIVFKLIKCFVHQSDESDI